MKVAWDYGIAMSKCAVLLLLISSASTFGQNCSQYGTSTSLAGRLFIRYESGYNQFIVLKLRQPACTSLDHRQDLEWERFLIRFGVSDRHNRSRLRWGLQRPSC